MNAFFKPLRRKIGIVLLLLACVLASGWTRSFRILDGVTFPVPNQQVVCIQSLYGRLTLRTTPITGYVAELPEWDSFQEDVVSQRKAENSAYRWIGGEPWGFSAGPFPVRYPAIGSAPYWSIVIPLMLLSVGLLFSKPKPTSDRPV